MVTRKANLHKLSINLPDKHKMIYCFIISIDEVYEHDQKSTRKCEVTHSSP